MSMQKTYEAKSVEERIYQTWEDSGLFRPEVNPEGEPFTISMPPPNATGQLHLGHAVMLAIEDIFTRQARMQGKAALWLPGTDHAAIATESVVIKQLQAGGMADPRKTLGREKLVAIIADFVEKSRDTIRGQVRRMGSSCDWTRERYTMDDSLNRMVNEAFLKMYHDELIYRGQRIVNWDPNMQTTVSDDEIERKAEKTPFYYFRYGPFEIGTARPETKFGDKYVVMHPEDERYRQYQHGDTFECEWLNGKVLATVIKDEAVDPEFGSGVMTITPWHDATDFEIAERNGLDKQQIIDFDGTLLPVAEEFAGMPIVQARPLIVEKLKEKGLLIRVEEDYEHNISLNYRGKGVIEPQIKPQWFINVNKEVNTWQGPWAGRQLSLKQVLQEVVREGSKGDEVVGIKILPARFEKTYFHWIDNLRDWCVSRQIWWGHRIPAWYHSDHEEPRIQIDSPGEGWEQDSDTLDTWFSSAMWTWSTLVDPELTPDKALSLKQLIALSPDRRFHPTEIMETGYDILFFWVARMILMTTYNIGEIPFRTVYLHGLVRTRDGSKMSKSNPESVIDPLDMIAKYGADALRLSLVIGTTPGNDTRLYEEKIAGYRNFCNKLWNASRFVLESKPPEFHVGLDFAAVTKDSLSFSDKKALKDLEQLETDVNALMSELHIGSAAQRLYNFVWSDYCDWLIEMAKESLNSEDVIERSRAQLVLLQILERLLRLLHPFIPFISEEIWQHLQTYYKTYITGNTALPLTRSDWLTTTAWAVQEDTQSAAPQARIVREPLKELVTTIRNLKSEMGQPNVTILELCVDIVKLELHEQQMLKENVSFIKRALKATKISFETNERATDDWVAFSAGIVSGVFQLEIAIDDGTKEEKLKKDLAEVVAAVARTEGLLANEKFVANAPRKIVESEQKKLAELREKQTILEGQLGKNVENNA